MNTRKLTAAAVAGAAYAALTILLAPISYGPIQFRVSEALCILPAFIPCTAWGLAAGCAISNLVSAYGILDIVFGSLATLGAGLCAAWIVKGRNHPLPAGRAAAVCLMPVIWNAPVVGALIAWSSAPTVFWSAFPLYAAQIGAEELGVMLVIGLPLLRLLPRYAPFMALMDKLKS
ncbi:MAG: QueT transporter family protein [Clostridia bacterium]|nr:QueT transporter family protein [Clostridia bacterium]